MTIREALYVFAAVQGWRRLPLCKKDQRPYGPGWFLNTKYWAGALVNKNRKVALRLGRLNNCIRCDCVLSPNSTGDHVIPLSKGGIPGAENYLPLCFPCNKRKRTQDLMEWLIFEGVDIATLHHDVLCLYCRLTYQWMVEKQMEMDIEAPAYLQLAATHCILALPIGHQGLLRNGVSKAINEWRNDGSGGTSANVARSL